MGFIRKLFIVVLIVSLMLSVSAVVAEDNITADLSMNSDLEVVSEEDSPLGESESQVFAAGDDFTSVQNMIDSAKAGDTIYLEGKTFKGNGKTIMVNKSVTLVGGFHDGDNVNATFDGQKQSRIMVINVSDVTLKGISFVNGNVIGFGNFYTQCGGALFVEDDMKNVSVEGCAFINNSAKGGGGAIYVNDGFTVDCVFVNNHAFRGGAMNGGSALNCVFEGNSASQGGAMHVGSAVNCVFEGNSAEEFYGAMSDGYADSCIFKTGNDTISSGTTSYGPSLIVFNYASSYKSGDRLKFNLTAHNGMEITNRNITVELYKNNVCVGTYECLSGEGLSVDLDVGSYVAVCRSSDYNIPSVNATLTILSPTKITSRSIVMAYNSNKYLVVTLRDVYGNPVSGVGISVDLGGVRNLLTDKNGQIKVSIKKLAPKTYTARITFEGNVNYLKSSAEAKVTVKKAKSKITAKKKTLKKVKKYTITLKSGKKPIKKVKVILKIKKKTFKAKTNKKGKATFKIKKLKKGTYKAKIAFKGNKYYDKVTKKVRITVK